MIKKRNKFSLLFSLLLIISHLSWGQSTLPEFDIKQKDGSYILNWTNPYTNNVKKVEVERRLEKENSFEKIGEIKNLNSAIQTFIDAHPHLGENQYRIRVTFNSNTHWISNVRSLEMDSLNLKKQQNLESTESIQEKLNKSNGNLEKAKEIIEKKYPSSKLIFTNPFTGHVNIEINNAIQQRYSVKFYDLNDKEVLYIDRIRQDISILDKRNFQKLGVYKFILYKNNDKIEEGYITIH
ncbi:MAG TPA: hypothetical protein VK027_05870 [Chitinophagaceae bacterium]|nr:hypothetical protein [Chitinophagaceae bacterium]